MLPNRGKQILLLAQQKKSVEANTKRYTLRKRTTKVNYLSHKIADDTANDTDFSPETSEFEISNSDATGSLSKIDISSTKADDSISKDDETLSLCSNSEKSESLEDCLIPYVKVTNIVDSNSQIVSTSAVPEKSFRNRMCNVGFDASNEVGSNIDNAEKGLMKENPNTLVGNELFDVELENNHQNENTDDKTNKRKSRPNADRVLVNFGNIVNKTSGGVTVEHIKTVRPWTKKFYCPYCFKEVTHFARHLERNHKEEGAVREILARPVKDHERKVLLSALSRQGNYLFGEQVNLVRPVRRQKDVGRTDSEEKDNYIACADCFGYFKRNYLRRHRKNCFMRSGENNKREQHLSQCQMMIVCSGNYSKFYDGLRLKKEVFTIMRADEISKVAMNDILICSYAEDLLGKHKRTQIKNVISNKMRELGRLLIQLKKTTAAQAMIDILKPEYFDAIVAATKVISGFNPNTKTYAASSLALHMGTTLRQICDTATKNIIKKSPFIQCPQPEACLKNIKRLKGLLVSHWNTDVSSLALKNLNEVHWEKPKMFPLTSDLIKFQQYVMSQAKEASENIQKENQLKTEYRRLSENLLALTVLLNRKRIGEVQYLTVKAYNSTASDIQQEEFLQSLTESEKILTQTFKRVVTGGKGSKPVAILFPKSLQKYIDLLLNKRNQCVPKTNEYLFANPKTENRWLSGYHTLKKLAEQSGVENKNLFTSTRLRKQIATVLQVMHITDNEMEQFASFMGHTKKTHANYYRLPQDIYQTAKVSKLLLAINKGKGAMYKGKTLDEIEFSDEIDSDTDTESTSNLIGEHSKDILDKTGNENKKVRKRKQTKENEETELQKETNSPIAGTSKIQSDLDSSSDDTESNENLEHKKKGKKRKIQRVRWTEEQKKIMSSFFKDHIKQKRPPKKDEVEKLINKYKKTFKEKNWVKIKAYVYNCYK